MSFAGWYTHGCGQWVHDQLAPCSVCLPPVGVAGADRRGAGGVVQTADQVAGSARDLPPARAWAARYVGIPFAEAGLDFSGCHCWGLVRLVLLHERAIDLPTYGETSAAQLLAAARRIESESRGPAWRYLPRRGEWRAFDVVLMHARQAGSGRVPGHVGIMTSPGRILHVERETDAVEVAIDHPTVRHRLIAAFRYQGAAGKGGPTAVNPDRAYCEPDQSCCDFAVATDMTDISLASLPVVWRERAFDGAVCSRQVAVRPGERPPTVEQIIAQSPELPRWFVRAGEVRINGELVPRTAWHLVRPRLVPGREVGITLHMPLRGGNTFGGGGGGGSSTKNTLVLVAKIAVVLVAAAVSGGAFGIGAGIGAFLGTSAAVGGAIAGAAIAIGGTLALAALTPPPSLPAIGAPGGGGGAAAGLSDSQGRPVSLQANVLAAGASVPRVVGTHLVFPPCLCEPLVELVGDREYGEVVYGLAGAHAISDVRVGNVPVAGIVELVTEVQEGRPESLIQTLVKRQGKTQTPALELSRHVADKTTQTQLENQSDPDSNSPHFHRLVTRDSPDEVWINLAWPEGLFYDSTPTATMLQPVRIRFRQRGTSTWKNAPEIMFSMNRVTPFQRAIRLHWATRPAVPPLPPANQGPIAAYKVVPGQTYAPTTAGWTADSYFSAGAGNDTLIQSTINTSNVINIELYAEKAVIYLDPATFPKDVYEIEIINGQIGALSTFNLSSYTSTLGGTLDFFKYYISGSGYTLFTDRSQAHDKIVVTRFSSVWNSNPIVAPDLFATIAVRVHSRALDQLSCLASGYVADWDGAGWNTLTTTSNPAAHFRDVLAGTLAAEPMPAVMIDDAELVDWRTRCNALGYTCDAVIDGRSQADVLDVIAGCGRARPRMSEKWGVFMDRDRTAEAPVQIFSPRNLSSFRFERGFNVRPTDLRVRFDDSTDDYREATLIVHDPDAAPDAAARFDEVRYDGLVDQVKAQARALFDLKQAARRLVFYFGEADIEAIVCRRGDLVGVQHDVISEEAGFARIKDVVRAPDASVSAIILDGTVPVRARPGLFSCPHLFTEPHVFDLGRRTGAAIRLTNQTSTVREVRAQGEEAARLDFVTPLPDPDFVLQRDCLVTIGRLGSEYVRLLVLDIAMTADLGATLTFVPEAPELWSDAPAAVAETNTHFVGRYRPAAARRAAA